MPTTRTPPGSPRLEGSAAVQRGVTLLQAFGPAAQVVARTAVDVFDPATGSGYQRERQAPRVRKAAEYYRSGGRLPNPLLVNVREADRERVALTVRRDRKGYEAAVAGGGCWIGVAELVVPPEVPIWVYDGQHREGAVRELLVHGEAFARLPVPLSLTIGLDTPEEMKEFYEVNQNAKAVRTDLAWELLGTMAASDASLAERLEVRGEDWKTRGAAVVRALEELGGVWAGAVQGPNVGRRRTDRLTLNTAQLIRSLRPVLAMPALAKADPDTVARILYAYWEGIATVLPEPFAPEHDPKAWVIQKGPGAIAFHRVLPQIVELLRARGRRLADPGAYVEVLADLPTLAGEVVHEDGTAEVVTGADFWLAGPRGVASQWTGDAGRKRLALRIQALLPRPAAELEL